MEALPGALKMTTVRSKKRLLELIASLEANMDTSIQMATGGNTPTKLASNAMNLNWKKNLFLNSLNQGSKTIKGPRLNHLDYNKY